ncbi:acyl-CoA N-acyltransferase [Syncephalastrum racemosum]|uniref:Acyl-CoA N-acyltransferase n=1 Tax=Syncephalastrum racemosum TaxID=13706 RepID=A0A1X2HDS2_SYNRA|nr:acyl-CoA N-acyltransferase [Syncephalastrum racemosum]
MCSRVEREPHYNLTNLYIMTLGVLAPYRRMGLGRLLLASIIQTARKQAGVRLVYLHVQTTNEAALHFYLNQGFRIYSTAKDYYQHISGSPDAHVLVRYL